MSFVEVAPDVRLYVEEDGDGRPVILIHGGSMTHSGWDHQVPALSREFRTITYDFRGIGRSDRPSHGYSIDVFAEDLQMLIEELGATGAAVVGYALGAHVALRLVATAPHLVSRLVLVSAAPWFVNADGDGGFPPELWAEMKRRAATDRAQADLALIDGQYFHRPASEGMRLWCAQMAFTWPLPVFEQLAATLPEINHDAALGAIDVPTLIIHGRHDRKNRYEGGAYLAGKIRGARMVTMEESAHCPLLEEVQDFNTVLLDFLRTPD